MTKTSTINFNAIPAWVIRKNCSGKFTEAACILAIQDGEVWVERETAKAVLVGWHNPGFMSCPYSGGQFWVAKSLLG